MTKITYADAQRYEKVDGKPVSCAVLRIKAYGEHKIARETLTELKRLGFVERLRNAYHQRRGICEDAIVRKVKELDVTGYNRLCGVS